MRRSSRNADFTSRSEDLPESDSIQASSSEKEIVKSSWMPHFRYVQSSPHSGVTNVNGESEVVHWVVKDRPFSIRILEIPSALCDALPEVKDVDSSFETEISWSEVEVKADVVYTKTQLPVKTSTGQAPLVIERSVIPPNIYNHRRSANNFDSHTSPSSGGQPRSLKLKEGAGLELHVRLSILSSHLRNDFCIHLKLYIRKQLVDQWYSQTIKSVSKWDKVRHLQDSSSLPHHHYHTSSNSSKSKSKNNSHQNNTPLASMASSPNTTLATAATTSTLSSRSSKRSSSSSPSHVVVGVGNGNGTTFASSSSASSHPQVSQKPVSSSLHKTDSSIMQEDNNMAEIEDQHHEIGSSPSSASGASVGLQTDSPHVSSSSSSRRHPSPRAEYSYDRDERSSHSKHSSKKKKASGEEVFEMLAKLNENLEELEHMSYTSSSSSSSTKKRRAHWDPSVDSYPTEQEAAEKARVRLSKVLTAPASPAIVNPTIAAAAASSSSSANIHRFKKFKLVEGPTAESYKVHAFSSNPDTQSIGSESSSASLERNANEFLRLLDTMTLSEVRSALNSVLLTRPDLAASLGRLMKYDPSSVNTRSNTSSASIPLISQSMDTATTSSVASNGPMNGLNGDLSAPWSSNDMMLNSLGSSSVNMLNQSTSNLWNDERYELGTCAVAAAEEMSRDDCYQMDTALGVCEAPLVMSPTAFEDDDSTTIGSPNSYASWSETDWSYEQETNVQAIAANHFESSLPHNPQLTDSIMFPASLETPAGF
jgi:hypothetical protein